MTVAACPPMLTELMTKSAPARALRRSASTRTVAGRPWRSTAMRASPSASSQPARVDVVHDEGQLVEVVVLEQIAQQLAGELRRTGADEAHRGHRSSMARLRAKRARPSRIVHRFWTDRAQIGEDGAHGTDRRDAARVLVVGDAQPRPRPARRRRARGSGRPSSCSTQADAGHRRFGRASPRTGSPASAARCRSSPRSARTCSAGRSATSSPPPGSTSTRCCARHDQPTGLTVVLSRADDRAILTLPGAIPTLTARRGARGRSTGSAASLAHVHVSSLFLQPALAESLADVLAEFRARGLTTSARHERRPGRTLARASTRCFRISTCCCRTAARSWRSARDGRPAPRGRARSPRAARWSSSRTARPARSPSDRTTTLVELPAGPDRCRSTPPAPATRSTPRSSTPGCAASTLADCLAARPRRRRPRGRRRRRHRRTTDVATT